jgi:hypothetical protein
MKKTYFANVELHVVPYFEKKLEERKDVITVAKKDETLRTTRRGTQYVYYELEAEEGIIDPDWELK